MAHAAEIARIELLRDAERKAHLLFDEMFGRGMIVPANTKPKRRPNAAGRPCHWILEVHLIDRERRFGGFFEQLLDVPMD